MKKYLLITITVLIAAALNCSNFPNRYDRIETSSIRPIGLTYAPYAEGGPGDTIHASAYFGGKNVTSVSLQMSYDVLSDYNSNRPTIINVFNISPTSQTLSLPDSMHFDFVIPESTYYKTRAITQNTMNSLKSQLPSSMGSMTQQDFAGFLADLHAIQPSNPLSIPAFLQKWGTTIGITTADSAGLASLGVIAAKVATAFSIEGVLYVNMTASDGSTLKMQGEFTIRLNKDFDADFPGMLPVNNNPTLRWMGVYSVKGADRNSFRPETVSTAGTYSTTYLHYQPRPWLADINASDTIFIDTGYTYYLAADSGMMHYTLASGTRIPAAILGNDTTWRTLGSDSAVTDTMRDKVYYTQAGQQKFELETWFYDWEYENLDAVPSPHDSLFMLSPGSSGGGGGENSIMKFLPSLDTRMKHVRVWVTVYDQAIGDYQRPSAFTIKTFDLYFKYSDAYVVKHIH